jgi:hypothetical protein
LGDHLPNRAYAYAPLLAVYPFSVLVVDTFGHLGALGILVTYFYKTLHGFYNQGDRALFFVLPGLPILVIRDYEGDLLSIICG